MRSWAIFAAGLLFGLCLAIGFSGRAQDALIISGLAYHLDQDHHCNSVTEGLGWERSQSENWRSQIGFYRNSNCRWSAYVAEAWMPLHWGKVSTGILGGIITGYRASITPAAGLVTIYELTKRWSLRLITIPPSGESGKGVMWLQAGLSW